MLQNNEDDLRIDMKRNDNRERIYSPLLSSNRSRHSSLSFVSNRNDDYDEFENNRHKSNSRLSFRDEIDDRNGRKKRGSDSNLKNLLKNELGLIRKSNESLRKSNRSFSDSDNENKQRRDRDHRD